MSEMKIYFVITCWLLAVGTQVYGLRCHTTCSDLARCSSSMHSQEKCANATPDLLLGLMSRFFPDRQVDFSKPENLPEPACYTAVTSVGQQAVTTRGCSSVGTALTCRVLRSNAATKGSTINFCEVCTGELCNEHVARENRPRVTSPPETTTVQQADSSLRCRKCRGGPCDVTEQCVEATPTLLKKVSGEFSAIVGVDLRPENKPRPACYAATATDEDGLRVFTSGCSSLGANLTCQVIRADVGRRGGAVESCLTCQENLCNPQQGGGEVTLTTLRTVQRPRVTKPPVVRSSLRCRKCRGGPCDVTEQCVEATPTLLQKVSGEFSANVAVDLSKPENKPRPACYAATATDEDGLRVFKSGCSSLGANLTCQVISADVGRRGGAVESCQTCQEDLCNLQSTLEKVTNASSSTIGLENEIVTEGRKAHTWAPRPVAEHRIEDRTRAKSSSSMRLAIVIWIVVPSIVAFVY